MQSFSGFATINKGNCSGSGTSDIEGVQNEGTALSDNECANKDALDDQGSL